jgi:hypothetical protein
MGQVCKSEQHLTWLHGDRDLRLRPARDESDLAQQNTYGT